MIKNILFLLLLSFILTACSNDEPSSNESKLVGYWAITHIQTIEHIGDGHNTTDIEVPPHGIDSYVDITNSRYDVLIFDEDFVTVRGDMPNRPKGKDYDLDTLEGNVLYCEDLEQWEQNIGTYTDDFGSPVGKYSVTDNDLIIGSLNMGQITFTSNDSFTLDYRKSLANSSDYRRSIYTYSRIYSLTL